MRDKIQVGHIYRAKNVLDEEEHKGFEWCFEILHGPIVVKRKRYWIAVMLNPNKPMKVLLSEEDTIYVTLFDSNGYEVGEQARMFGPVYRLIKTA